MKILMKSETCQMIAGYMVPSGTAKANNGEHKTQSKTKY